VGFFGEIWARMMGTDAPAVAPGLPGVPRLDPAVASPPRPARSPRGAVDELAIRSADALSAILTDPQRLKWVLLQPEAGAAARRFSSMARLGEKRADEAREARESFRSLLEIELPGESAEHIEMLLDLIQSDARQAGGQHVASAPVPRFDDIATAPPAADADFPAAYAEEPPAPAPEPRPHVEPESPPRTTPEPVSGPAAPAPSATVAPVEYELHILPGTGMQDVDAALVREYVQGSLRRRAGSPLEEIGVTDVLRALTAVVGSPGRERLTVLGGLYFALRPERLVVQSKVRFVEFPGTEVASPGETVTYRYTEEVTGTIPQLIARMEQIHKERLAPGVLADGFRVEEVPSVPLFALREAMVNAVCHRDYSLIGANIQVRLFEDRLEVQSPGGLPGPVTVDNILTESYARNPRVADILRDLGYVERHGLGIDNMVQSMKDAHLPPPEFINSSTSFTVVLRFRPAPVSATLSGDLLDSLSPAQRRILDIVARQGRARASDVLEISGLKDRRTVQRTLGALTERGLLVRHASSRTDPNATYEVATGPRE
jgi:ATP-dependent DNA helicase RecG